MVGVMVELVVIITQSHYHPHHHSHHHPEVMVGDDCGNDGGDDGGGDGGPQSILLVMLQHWTQHSTS